MNRLLVTGIDAKGDGKIYKLVMRTPDIPLCAQLLYAYLCLYTGNGTIAFPSGKR